MYLDMPVSVCKFQKNLCVSRAYHVHLVHHPINNLSLSRYTRLLSAFLMAPGRKRNNNSLWNHDEIPVSASTLELSRDGKCVRWDMAEVQPAAPLPASGSGATIVEAPEYFSEDSALPFDDNVPLQEGSEGGPTIETAKPSRKRYLNTVSFDIRVFLEHSF